jgi:uncharacterized membrane protein YeaQ/YmgE (transglycosylase-associated protein family)
LQQVFSKKRIQAITAKPPPYFILTAIMGDLQEKKIIKTSQKGGRLRNVIVDLLIVGVSSALIFYLALNSITAAQYAGAGFQYINQGLIESIVLLVIFSLGLSRLVIDLRAR